jgi:hypothetical protein
MPAVICVAAIEGALDGQGLHQPDLGQLGRAVVGLAEVAVQARRGGGHDDAAVGLGAHDLPHRLGTDGGAHQVHVHHQSEIVHRHLGEALVAQDAGVVDQDVDPAPGLHRRIDHRLDRVHIGHRPGRRHRLTARRDDLVNHALRRRLGQIIDHDPRALRGQIQRVTAAQTPARTRHDRHSVLQQHPCKLLLMMEH